MADNRKWTGELDIRVFFDGHRSVARDIYFQRALKVIRPIYLNGSNIPTFYIVNVGGGYLDGDRYNMDITVDPDAAVTLTSQGATKIYKTPTDKVEQYQTFTIKERGYMEFIADPVIAYENSKFFQQNKFYLDKTASMFYTDILTPGYSQSDKHFTYTYMHLMNEIYVDGTLAVYDNLLMDPRRNKLTEIGYMEGYTHLGSCFFIHPDVKQPLLETIHDDIIVKFEQAYHCRIGITLLPVAGFAIRILANQTGLIENILTEIQTYVVKHYFDRDVAFLRKY